MFVPPLALDRSSATPLYVQIRSQIAKAVGGGGRAGARLPSTRLLAQMLGVSRQTIMTAYEDLAADGLVEGQPGSGMIVATAPRGPMSGLDPQRVLRNAQYPARTLALEDPDGSALYLSY